MRSAWFHKPLYVIPILGVAGGIFLGTGMIWEARNVGRENMSPRRIAAAPTRADYVMDPVARDMGYVMGLAADKKSAESCQSLSPEFRSGCIEYVEEQAARLPAERP